MMRIAVAERGPTSTTPLDAPFLLTLAWPAGALSMPVRLRCAELLERLRDALQRRFAAAASLEPAADAGAAATFAPRGGGVTMTVACAHGRIALELDADAARALADCVARRLANLRGCGPISDAERGIVHFALLELADELALAVAPGDWRVEGLDAPLVADAGRATLVLRLGLPGGAGCVRVHVAPELLARVELEGSLWRRSLERRAAHEVTLHLALPPVAVGREELAQLQPGSVLLLGRSSLDVASGCEVATETGWSLARGGVKALPGLATVQCDSVAPHALDIDTGDREVLLRPRLGALRVTLGRLAALRCGDRLDFRAPTHRAVQIVGPHGIAAEGDLEDLGGELGVRIA